ncbi:hypothetical protein A8938_0888 [Algoriphagus zhangzhouensis]|uniref:Uncharacterized protein n=1 Tax=Algoriphagus zhangzhouensis TaxID=1073327 RepID=A0A1M7Z6K9_9BACT|nr:hypothetical protein A8938_0888 [Algoriphagus zhangzhouensis]SHO60577.1 hypothetical protein SAMN04488108_0888 [Algoriphagus zhangzhouensis]
MTTDTHIPKRQRIFLVIAISIGILLLSTYQLNLIKNGTLGVLIFLYSFGLSMSLLVSSALVDLNNLNTYLAWLSLSIIMLLVYWWTKDSPDFSISRTMDFYEKSKFNIYVTNSGTNALRTLFFFLIVYQLCNIFMKRLISKPLVNTFNQFSWTHDSSRRRITIFDVTFNIILYCVVIGSAVLK